MEALERAVAEIEVLESIYGSSDDGAEDDTSFRVVSQDALESARSILSNGDGSSAPRLDVVVLLPITAEDTTTTAVLRCGMPPRYPISQAAIVSVEVPGLTRSSQDELSGELNQYAQQLVGEEAILGLAQKLQEIGTKAVEATAQKSRDTTTSNSEDPSSFSRQWLFMDHIKAESRRAQMIRQAADLQLGGLIKPGYPGVCVVEGESKQVDEFVAWMKQIWIGRVAVRGEVTMEQQQLLLRRFPKELVDLGEGKNLPNMGVLGSACREAELEDEFLEYIMQIRPSS